MVDWSSPQEIARDNVAFRQVFHVLIGLYIWEWFNSLDFDWLYISGKKPFRWPIIFYFLNRYTLLFSLIGTIIALDVTTKINCHALYTFSQIIGNMAIGLSSLNLAIRTIAVWSLKRYIVVPVVLMILGHWCILLRGITLKAEWDSNKSACVVPTTDNRLIIIIFIYSMAFDFIILCLTAYKLISKFGVNDAVRPSLSTIMFTQGLIFFVIAFMANCMATIFMYINLNTPMSMMANGPASTTSTIVACRVVRHLANYTDRRFSAVSAHGSPLPFHAAAEQLSIIPPAFFKRTVLGDEKLELECAMIQQQMLFSPIFGPPMHATAV